MTAVIQDVLGISHEALHIRHGNDATVISRCQMAKIISGLNTVHDTVTKGTSWRDMQVCEGLVDCMSCLVEEIR